MRIKAVIRAGAFSLRANRCRTEAFLIASLLNGGKFEFTRQAITWIEGIQFTSPNYLTPRAGDVPLEFFLKPVDDAADDFTGPRLRRIVRGLLKNIYYLDIDGDDGESLKEYAPLRLKPIKC